MPPEDSAVLSVDTPVARAEAASVPASEPAPEAAPFPSSDLPPAESEPASVEASSPVADDARAAGPRSVRRPAAAVPVPSVSRRELPEEGKAALRHPLVQDLLLNPSRWRLWPAMAIIRWLQRQMRRNRIRIVYRTRPSLSFPASEIADIYFVRPNELQVVVNALGLANAGSALPSADVARVIADYRSGGGLATWLDMVADRMLHAAETSVARSASPFACAMGGFPEADSVLPSIVGHDGVLAESRLDGLSPSRRAGTRRLTALGALFLGVPTAHGLARAFEGFTSLHARVVEFTGAPLDVSRPARLGPGSGGCSDPGASSRKPASPCASTMGRPARTRWRGRAIRCESDRSTSSPGPTSGIRRPSPRSSWSFAPTSSPPGAGRAQCAARRVRDAEPSPDRAHHSRAPPPVSGAAAAGTAASRDVPSISWVSDRSPPCPCSRSNAAAPSRAPGADQRAARPSISRCTAMATITRAMAPVSGAANVSITSLSLARLSGLSGSSAESGDCSASSPASWRSPPPSARPVTTVTNGARPRSSVHKKAVSATSAPPDSHSVEVDFDLTRRGSSEPRNCVCASHCSAGERTDPPAADASPGPGPTHPGLDKAAHMVDHRPTDAHEREALNRSESQCASRRPLIPVERRCRHRAWSRDLDDRRRLRTPRNSRNCGIRKVHHQDARSTPGKESTHRRNRRYRRHPDTGIQGFQGTSGSS